MELVNTTAAPADITVALVGSGLRMGLVVAKTTFRFDRFGTQLETQAPIGLFDDDQPVELGLLPSDMTPPRDAKLEVILLARSRPGRPMLSHDVSLSIGTETRRMRVFGDRKWDTSGKLSRPQPFEDMPLTWNRAFGGQAEVWLDRNSSVFIADPLNKHGRGFDPTTQARGLARYLGVPPGFPVFERQRDVPNLEHPDIPIRTPSCSPRPLCWATIPRDIGFASIGRIERARNNQLDTDPDASQTSLARRAHPDWLIEPPTIGARITMIGLRAHPIAFDLPRLQVVADCAEGARRPRSVALTPHTLVLLPEENRFYIVHRTLFCLSDPSGVDRSIRLRLVDQGDTGTR